MTRVLQPLVAILLAGGDGYTRIDEIDGVLMESRPVPASSFVELRLTATSTASPAALCAAIFGDGKLNTEEPDLVSRKVLEESENERVTYDQISPPVVSNRDYTVRTRRFFDPGGRCRITTDPANELAPKPAAGWVRITKVRCRWLAEPLPDGKTRLTYEVHTDPAGSVPAFLVEGSRRKLALQWIKMIIARAEKPAAAAK